MYTTAGIYVVIAHNLHTLCCRWQRSIKDGLAVSETEFVELKSSIFLS